jgi:hypothetical protein
LILIISLVEKLNIQSKTVFMIGLKTILSRDLATISPYPPCAVIETR